VEFKPALDDDDDNPNAAKKSADPQFMDISHAIKVDSNADPTAPLHYVKLNDSTLTDYSLDFTITHPDTDTAIIEGTCTYQGVQRILTGHSAATNVKVKVESTLLDIPRPAGLDPSLKLESLRQLTPIADKDTTLYKKGTDQAQTAGDAMMFQVRCSAECIIASASH
jgi:hypothetical protein